MPRQFILVHENGGSAASAEVIDDRAAAMKAFRAKTTGSASLFEFRRSQAIKRSNFDIHHEDAKDSLDKKNDTQLRAEARKRNLAVADYPLASRSQIINEIQQHELSQRLAHRVPLTSSDQKLEVKGQKTAAEPEPDTHTKRRSK